MSTNYCQILKKLNPTQTLDCPHLYESNEQILNDATHKSNYTMKFSPLLKNHGFTDQDIQNFLNDNSNSTIINSSNTNTSSNFVYSYGKYSSFTTFFILCEFFFWFASIWILINNKVSFTEYTDENADADTDTDKPSTQKKTPPARFAGGFMIAANVFTSIFLLYFLYKCLNAGYKDFNGLEWSYMSWAFFVFAVLTIIKIVLVSVYFR